MEQSTFEIAAFLVRGIERLLIIVSAFTSIWLGYKLFRIVVADTGSFIGEAGQWKIRMQRIGPGIFFALFGASVLLLALKSPYEYSSPPLRTANLNGAAQETIGEFRKYANNTPISNSSQDAQQLLVAITSNQDIIRRNFSSLVGPDASTIVQNGPIINRLKTKLVDDIFGKGAYEWYASNFSLYSAVSDGDNSVNKEELSKFRAIKQYFPSESTGK